MKLSMQQDGKIFAGVITSAYHKYIIVHAEDGKENYCYQTVH